MGKSSNEEDDFKMTADEMNRIKTALNQKEFRDLLVEYANDISDPVNKKKYEEEIVALEKQRGQDIRLLKPQAGFVVKLVRLSDQMKVFINICTSPEIQQHTTTQGSQNGKLGTHVSLPHSIVPAREDLDRAGKHCIVYDVCFNPKSYEEAMQNSAFRDLLINTAIDGLEQHSNEKFDRKRKKFPKLKYKGTPQSSILREGNKENNNFTDFNKSNTHCMNINKIVGFPEANRNENDDRTKASDGYKEKKDHIKMTETGKIVPSYKIVHRGYFDMQDFTIDSSNQSNGKPKELVITIELPTVKSSSELDLDIFERRLVLESSKYHLDINLSYTVDEEKGKAQFDKAINALTVILPLLKREEEILIKPSVEVVEDIEEAGDTSKNIQEQCTEHTPEVENGNVSTNGSDIEVGEKSKINTNGCVVNNHASVENGVCNDVTIQAAIDEKDVISKSKNKGFNLNSEKHFTNGVLENDGDLEEELNSSILKSPCSLFAKLPPYTYEQTEDTVKVIINIPDVKVCDLSISFTETKVFVSFPQDSGDMSSADWSLVLHLDEGNSLKKKECTFDVTSDHLQITLMKKEQGLWTKMFVGVSETELKLEFFLTDDMKEAILNNFKKSQEEVCSVETNKVESNEDVKDVACLESRLSELLREQEQTTFRDDEFLKEFEKKQENNSISLKDEKKERKRNSSAGNEESSDELSLDVNLLDLQDDVIDTSGNESVKPATKSKRVVERSLSCPYPHSRLKSILKRSKSDSANYETDEEYFDMHHNLTAAISDDCYYASTDEDSFKRRRHKSVSFREKPIVFEFENLSRRQWKKHYKEGILSNQTPTSLIPAGSKGKSETKKESKKKRKAEKKRQRNNSESKSEEEIEPSDLSTKKNRKKKKNKHKNKHVDASICSSGRESSGTDTATSHEKPSLSNPLIFQLD